MQTTFAGDDIAIFANLFVFLNISDFMSIFKPQWRLKTSMEVYYLNPDLYRTCYFQGFWEKGHLFSGIWGESITFWSFREQGAEEKHFRELGRKVIFLTGSREQRPPWVRVGRGC